MPLALRTQLMGQIMNSVVHVKVLKRTHDFPCKEMGDHTSQRKNFYLSRNHSHDLWFLTKVKCKCYFSLPRAVSHFLTRAKAC